jgi:hypothetical protein
LATAPRGALQDRERALSRTPKELVQPQPECSGVAFLVEHVRAELGFEPTLKHTRTNKPLPDNKSYVLAISRTVPDELRQNHIVYLEDTNPEMLEVPRR